MFFPLAQEIEYQDPWEIFTYFHDQNGTIFFDSAQKKEGCGDYSMIGVDPFFKFKIKNNEIYFNDVKMLCRNPFAILAQKLKEFPLYNHPHMPPFQGGIAGLFSYDLCVYLEEIVQCEDDMNIPDMAIGFYDVVIGFDHTEKKSWIFSCGYPEKKAREKKAKMRLNFILKQLQNKKKYVLSKNICKSATIQSNFTADNYQQAVVKVKNYILAGDIFQANISQRFLTSVSQITAFDLFTRLRHFNPSPFSAFFNYDDFAIVSASPERFIKLTKDAVETRPIKGTRPRGTTHEKDLALGIELMNSAKDQAENIMIVDLMRNDISRVCENNSVIVEQLCGLESYSTVHHLVSVVRGKLKNHLTAIDLLQATFPGGSITGAPKIRAMNIIAEIEPTQRGAYCGSLGYIGFNGDLDSSILIRTYTFKNNIVTFQAGGAIVLDSDPLQEYEETLIKAAALKKSLTEYTII